MSGDPSGSPRAVDWAPSKAQWTWINLVGVALTVLGFVGHFAAWALSRSASGGRFGLIDVVMVIVVTVVLIVAHELGHGLALLTLGHRPTFGVARVGRVVGFDDDGARGSDVPACVRLRRPGPTRTAHLGDSFLGRLRADGRGSGRAGGDSPGRVCRGPRPCRPCVANTAGQPH